MIVREHLLRSADGERVERHRRRQIADELAGALPVEALTLFIEAELPRLEALNEPDDAVGEVGS